MPRSNSTQSIGNNAFVNSRIVRTIACKLHAVVGFNNGVDRYVHIHETAAVPANGTTPLFCFPADNARSFAFNLPDRPVDMSACTVVFSSTAETTTIVASGDASIQAILAV